MRVQPILFPTNISAGSKGAPGFNTVVVTTGSGREQAIQNWGRSKGKWNVGFQLIPTPAQLQSFIEFLQVCQGRANGFLYLDYFDNASAAAPGDYIGTGDGATTVFQLQRAYVYSGATTVYRKITRPQTGTVQIYFGSTLQSSGWSVNTTTGQVTFTTAPTSGTVINAVFQFYVPVRFEEDYSEMDLDGIVAAWQNISLVEVLE